MSITGFLEQHLPTYGNYGGLDYSGGVFVLPGQQPDYSVTPIDDLDALFLEHDKGSGAPTSDLRADADYALLVGIHGLKDVPLTPEGHLWAGAATLAMIADIAIRQGHPEKIPPNEALDFSGEALQHIAQSGVDPFSPYAVAIENSLEQAWSWTSHLNVLDGIF